MKKDRLLEIIREEISAALTESETIDLPGDPNKLPSKQKEMAIKQARTMAKDMTIGTPKNPVEFVEEEQLDEMAKITEPIRKGIEVAVSRMTQQKSGMTLGIGIRGFIGAEYFIFPKIAVGAEYGWGLGYQMTGKGSKTTEEQGLDASGNNIVGTVERKTEGNSKLGIDTDLNQGNMFGFKGSNTGTASLRVTFHF